MDLKCKEFSDMEEKKRIHLYFNKESEDTYETLLKRKKEKQLEGKTSSWATVIDDLIQENELLRVRVDDREFQEKLFMEQLVKVLTPIRIRTGYTDKNSRILLEIVNGLLYKFDIEKLIDTGTIITEPLADAKRKVTSDIDKQVKKNLERKNQRTMMNHE